MIIVKSISRFVRNTVDSLVTIRKLKEHGAKCYFEKEGIYTFDGKGEFLITIMSSLAQEKSRSISENITWGQRKSFSDGKVHLPYKRFLGYKKGEDGRPAVVEDEAAIVRLIYRLFLDGKTPVGICRYLENHSIPSPSGKKVEHHHSEQYPHQREVLCSAGHHIPDGVYRGLVCFQGLPQSAIH